MVKIELYGGPRDGKVIELEGLSNEFEADFRGQTYFYKLTNQIRDGMVLYVFNRNKKAVK